jgi:diacylglycerol kinase (ATP)
MRVALLHNASSGAEDHSATELSALIQKAGHEVAHVARSLDALTAALHALPCDLVVVAGGDGTVGKAACELSGWQVPLAIMALGTANNTARSLKLPARLRKAAKGWDGAPSVPFDLGLLSDGTLRQRFAEGIGWGVFPEAIRQAKLHPRRDGASVKRTLKRDRKRFCTTASQARARFYGVEVDGRDASGEYLLVEVMNLPLLGPRLALSPTSDPSDGAFEVVLVSEAERPLLADLGATGTMPSSGVRVERGSHIRVTAGEGVLHRDGKLVRHAPGDRTFDISVAPAAISYLHPRG